jgi:hypothetical protein
LHHEYSTDHHQSQALARYAVAHLKDPFVTTADVFAASAVFPATEALGKVGTGGRVELTNWLAALVLETATWFFDPAPQPGGFARPQRFIGAVSDFFTCQTTADISCR